MLSINQLLTQRYSLNMGKQERIRSFIVLRNLLISRFDLCVVALVNITEEVFIMALIQDFWSEDDVQYYIAVQIKGIGYFVTR